MSALPLHLPLGVTWIDTAQALAEALPNLRGAKELALDTEADSYYAYHVKVCLLQISSREQDWLIDPLAGLDLAPIGELCADPKVLKVFHAASNDVGLLRLNQGFEFANLFDTMIAAQVLGLRRPGLASLLLERFGVEQKKTYQTSDWGKRPLTPGQLQYAAADTHFLLPMHDQLRAELAAKRRLDEAHEDFERLCSSAQTVRELDPDAWLRAPGAPTLDPLQMQALRQLFELRDRIASQRDRSPHRIFSDSVLVGVARALPGRRDHLRAIPGVPGRQLERDAAALLQAIVAARALGPYVRERRRSRGFEGESPLVEGDKRAFEALREWRRERAATRDVEESRVATTGTLRALAREPSLNRELLRRIPGMSPYRVAEYGEEILAVVARARADAIRTDDAPSSPR